MNFSILDGFHVFALHSTHKNIALKAPLDDKQNVNITSGIVAGERWWLKLYGGLFYDHIRERKHFGFTCYNHFKIQSPSPHPGIVWVIAGGCIWARELLCLRVVINFAVHPDLPWQRSVRRGVERLGKHVTERFFFKRIFIFEIKFLLLQE